MSSSTHINILLCTFNGARFLEEQLASYLEQTHDDWSLWVSDDESTDQTVEIIKRFSAKNPSRSVRLIKGPGKGPAQNFLSLINRVNCDGGIFALSDQDDVWLPDRLKRAAEMLGAVSPEKPAVYGCRTIQTNAKLKQFRNPLSPVVRPAFGNALVQNILAGNTMALNSGAVELIRKAGRIKGLPFHDWWIYLLISGAGGIVIFDENPRLLYRQHSRNFLGAHHGLGAFVLRFSMVTDGRYRHWIHSNANALAEVGNLLSPENQVILREFLETDATLGLRRTRLFGRLGIRRQTRMGNFLLANLALFGRV